MSVVVIQNCENNENIDQAVEKFSWLESEYSICLILSVREKEATMGVYRG